MCSSDLTHRVSGWGHIIGDEGSAYSIGIQIMNAVMKAYDGRGKATCLTKLLLERMGLDTPEEIIGAIYRPEVTKQHIAEYAILIDTAAQQQDEVAFDIIKVTATQLYETVAAAIKRLGFTDKTVKVVINGSVLVHNQYIRKIFEEKLSEVYPLAQVMTMQQDAAYGAVLLAKSSISK